MRHLFVLLARAVIIPWRHCTKIGGHICLTSMLERATRKNWFWRWRQIRHCGR